LSAKCRVPHFIGLHAIQAFALIAIAVRRWRRSEAVRVKAVFVAAASYTSLFLLLLWSALWGQSVAAPDATMVASLAIWLGATLSGYAWIGASSRRPSRDHSSWTVA
jgi:hypothetical protein